MSRQVDVAVIGAGHAGLNAIKEIRKVTDNYVLINGGQLGTTCARFGCMPSKVAVHLAEIYNNRTQHHKLGITGGDSIRIDLPDALQRIRDLRDMFVDLILANTTDEMGDELIEGYARFRSFRTLVVGDRVIDTKATVIATGARSFVPPDWLQFTDGILTVETVFDQEALPESIAVLGLGPMGLELAQALHRLGIKVVGIERGNYIARIADPVVNRAATEIIGREFPIWRGTPVSIQRQGKAFLVQAAGREAVVDKLLVAVGRRPNVDRLGLHRLGLATDSHGVPVCNQYKMQIEGLPIYVAGDAAGGLATLQKAADQGRIAGYNATRHTSVEFKPKTRMSIVFCDPNVAAVGSLWTELDGRSIAVGEARFGPSGRAIISGQNRGILRIYADKKTARITGAAMIGSHCEYLAHLLAWAIEQKLNVTEALRMPYYHPVFEEVVQDALYALDKQLNGAHAVAMSLERSMLPLSLPQEHDICAAPDRAYPT